MLDVLLSWFGSTLGKTYTVLSILLPVVIASTWLTLFALQYHFTRSHSERKAN